MNGKNIGKLIRSYVKNEVFVVTAEMYELNKKEMFSKKDVAELFSVSERTLDRWRHENKIVAFENGEKGKVLFPKSEILRLLKEMRNV
ncbi:MAG: helix-turn-helix domain-containing protein [Fluviicola sp.]|nr:helix-turn-helix domain-containing protein [Fluviicola sp.]